MNIKLLTSKNAQAYKDLRLKALQTNPEAYFSTYEREAKRTLQAFAYDLAYAHYNEIFGYYGVFDNEKLVGYVHIDQSSFPKQQHTSTLYNLYVDPDYRKQHIATQLITHILNMLRSDSSIEIVYVNYINNNIPARKLYEKLGFKECGREPRSVKNEDGEYDEKVTMYLEVGS